MPSTPGSNYYQPYCVRCQTYVHPQIASRTYIGYGPQFVSSTTNTNKYCPFCGNQVVSQEDIDIEKKRRRNRRWITGIILLFIFGPSILFGPGTLVFGFIASKISSVFLDFFVIYAFGGFISGIALSVSYFVHLFRHVSRWPWSLALLLGWLLAGAGLALAWFNAKPGHMESPALTLAQGCLYVSPGLYWLALLLFWISRKYFGNRF